MKLIRMKYTIRLFRGMAQYTTYDGASYASACKAVDTARSILILTGGTATITAQYNGIGANYPVYDVVDGQASAKIAVREQMIVEDSQ